MANPRLYSNLKDFKFEGPITDPWTGTATPPRPGRGPATLLQQGYPHIQLGVGKDELATVGMRPTDTYVDAVGPDQIQGFSGYRQNPLEAAGRDRIGQQFMQAPLGGYVRDFAVNQLKLGNAHGMMAERGLAGLTATGIGVPAFLAAVQGLNTPDTAETIPLA